MILNMNTDYYICIQEQMGIQYVNELKIERRRIIYHQELKYLFIKLPDTVLEKCLWLKFSHHYILKFILIPPYLFDFITHSVNIIIPNVSLFNLLSHNGYIRSNLKIKSWLSFYYPI